jgi:ABC-type Fe3+ transport system permease subunit
MTCGGFVPLQGEKTLCRKTEWTLKASSPSTIVLYRPPWKPMTAVIFENTLVDADFGVSAAQAILLMLIIYIPLYFIVRYGQIRGKSGG